jgi:hypothetical protein
MYMGYVTCPVERILVHETAASQQKKTTESALSRAAYGQLPHLLQYGFDLSIQLTGGVIVPDGIVEIPLDVTQFLVPILGELALYADHRLERRIEVRDAQAEELREFCDELVVEEVKDLFGFVVFLLGSRDFRRIVAWLCERFV